MKKRLVKNWILTVLAIYDQAYGELAAQTGTGYDYMPSYVTVKGGGDML